MSLLWIRNVLKKDRGPYQYRPLTGYLDIRLLTLFPGLWDSPIKCNLRRVSLQDFPQYEALSYVWGNAADKKSIILDKSVFYVTQNLDAALRSIRDEHKSRVLWIDAICIDQGNIPERNQQVRIMWRIYEQARVVLAWLGNNEDQSDQAMTVLIDLGETVRRIQEDGSSDTPSFPEFDVDSFTAVWRLLQRPYWTRIWIIQEQYFSGDPWTRDQDRCLIGCGRQWISRFNLTGALGFLQMLGQATGGTVMNFDGGRTDEVYRQMGVNRTLMFDESPAIQMYETIKLAKYLEKNASATDQLSIVMRNTRHFNATEPKDMVFALLGLLREVNTTFKIDYAEAMDSILKKTVDFTISRDKNLLILRGNRGEDRGDGPSWLPNPSYYLRSTKPWNKLRMYEASKNLQAEKPRFGNHERILFIHGVVIGTVTTRIGPFWNMNTLLMTEWTGGAEHPCTILKEYSKSLSEDRREGLWRTLVLDQETLIDDVIHPAPDELAQMYDVLINNASIPADFEPEMREQRNAFQHRMMFTYRFANNMSMCGGERCFFDTDTGYMGMGPYGTEPGDLVVVFRGGSFPFVLRPVGEYYVLVGDAYVHGAMNGEFINLDERENLVDAQEFGLR